MPRAEQLQRLRARMAAVPARAGGDRRRAGEPQLPSRTTDPAEIVAVDSAVGGLLAGGGLARGTVVCCTGSATVLVSLLAAASQSGAHVAVVSASGLGLLAYAEMGGSLDRLACVSPPAGADLVEVAAVLVDGVDVVVLGDAGVRMAPSRARVIAARVREHGAVLVTVSPETIRASTHIDARAIAYDGLGKGAGRLRGAVFEVVVTDRSGAPCRGRVVLDGTLPGRVRWRAGASTAGGSRRGLERTG